MGTVSTEVQVPPGKTARKAVRAALALILVVLVVVGVAASWFYWKENANLPQLDGTVLLPGLAQPVEVLRDARGVPHVYAQSLEDVAMAQGYITASDRLWQMEFSRRLGGENFPRWSAARR